MYTLCKDCCFCISSVYVFVDKRMWQSFWRTCLKGKGLKHLLSMERKCFLRYWSHEGQGEFIQLQRLINTNINSHAWTLAVLPHLIFLWPSVISVSDVVRLEGLMELYSQGCERSYTVNSSILRAIEPHLKDFQQLLLNPPTVPALNTHSHATPSGRKCHLRAFFVW